MKRDDPVRPEIRKMHGYTPGEQPDPNRPLVKLNTNESPFPPPQVVRDAMIRAIDDDLRLYPEPSSLSVRQAAAEAYGLIPDQIVVGNGSDDLLTMILRTFIDPRQVVAAPTPTYSLYETLTTIQGGQFRSVPWPSDLSLPTDDLLATGAKVLFVVRPNAPTGHLVPLASLDELCRRCEGIVVLDEAYVDFAENNGVPLLREHDNLIITRTFSKSLALAGLRIGLGLTSPALAEQMHKVRDSYNLNRVAQAGAVAALRHLPLYQPGIQAIRQQRQVVTTALQARGFQVTESQANFILATVPPDGRSGLEWLNDLRKQGYLIRYFGSDPRLTDKIRITIGSQTQMQGFLTAVDHLL